MSGAVFQSGNGGQECGDRTGFRRLVRDQQPGPAGPGDEFPGGGEEPVPPPLHVPSPGFVAGWQRGQLQPGNQVQGQCSKGGPGLVGVEVEERQLPEPGVLQGFDPVLTPSPGPVPGIQERPVPARGVRQERGDFVPVGIEQGRLRAGVQGLGTQVRFVPAG